MTSQVALVNRMAVALASDSMVTFGSHQTFPNVNKIYTLGGRHKIAVMVSGSANYIPGNIHWERVVSMWSENIGADKTLDSLDEYVKEFIHFLQHEKDLNDTVDNALALERMSYRWLRDEINPIKVYFDARQTVNSVSENYKMNTEEFLMNIEKQCFDALKEFRLNQMEMLESKLDDAKFKDRYERIKKYCIKSITSSVELLASSQGANFNHHSVFEDDWDDDEVRSIDLTELVLAHLTYQLTYNEYGLLFPGQEHTMITIAGFGDKDVVPKMVELISRWNEWGSAPLRERKKYSTVQLLHSFVIRKQSSLRDDGRLRLICDECTHEKGQEVQLVEDDCPHPENTRYQSASAFLRGIAEKTEIDTVLNGMRTKSFDPHNFASESAELLTSGILYDVNNLKGFGKEKMSRLNKLFEDETFYKIHGALVSQLQESNLKNFIARRQEFRKVTASLPVVDLGRFAHHLVNHQAEITRLTEPIRHVGGSIKVALITKEDGITFVEH